MFHTKVVQKIKAQILCSVTFFLTSRRLRHIVEKYGTARQAAENTAHALCVLGN
jgi:hypothetical protein